MKKVSEALFSLRLFEELPEMKKIFLLCITLHYSVGTVAFYTTENMAYDSPDNVLMSASVKGYSNSVFPAQKSYNVQCSFQFYVIKSPLLGLSFPMRYATSRRTNSSLRLAAVD